MKGGEYMDTIKTIYDKVRSLRDETKDSVMQCDDAKGMALLETTYEVLAGLEQAFDHCLHKTEEAWK